jgi:SPP1 gp7 family putative phage head morphogenesis protein
MNEDKNIFSEEEEDLILRGIWIGLFSASRLPKKLYSKTASHLVDGVKEGFGKKSDYLVSLEENIYMFSAAKTYQQTKEMSLNVLNSEGAKRSFKEFKDMASPVFGEYNKNYLKSEYVTAVSGARNAANWKSFNEDFRQLKYSAVIDSHTSELCKSLNGYVADKSDPIWKRISPPAHFNCRCKVQEINGEINKTEVGDLNPAFENNTGDTGKIFSNNHPYFSVPSKDEAYARRNFDLKIPNSK